MVPTSLFTWWNAIYSLPLAFVLLFLAITSVVSLVGGAFGELTHGETDSDVDADVGHVEAHHDGGLDVGGHGVHHDVGGHDAHHDVDADADVDADLDVDADVDVDGGETASTAHGGHGSGTSGLHEALAFLGVGQAPLVMLLQILLLFWGLIGIALHQTFGAAGPSALLWSLPITLLLSVMGTRGFAAAFGRFFKPVETSALRRDQIVGRTGRVVFPVTEETGTVHVRDQHGTLHRLQAHSAQGRLESGQEIIVLGYDREKKRYQVDDASSFVDR